MTILLFNSNSIWFETPAGVELGKEIRDGNLFAVQCEFYSWPVSDLYQEWGVNDFPEQTALRIARFSIQSAPDDLPNWTDERTRSDFYWILLYPTDNNDGVPIPVLCDAVDKQFFGVAIDKESARKISSVSEKTQAIITVLVRIISDDYSEGKWAELCVNRQKSDNWAPAKVRFV